MDDVEDDEDDGFVPRKLFLFSFTHFKVSAKLFVCLIAVLFFVVFFGGWGCLCTKSSLFLLLIATIHNQELRVIFQNRMKNLYITRKHVFEDPDRRN